MAATWTGWARQLTGRPHVHHCYLILGHDVTARACQREHRSYRTAKACADTAAQRCNRVTTSTGGGAMSTYQLACGCWESDRGWYEVGGVFYPGCTRHGRQVVIGVTRPYTAACDKRN